FDQTRADHDAKPKPSKEPDNENRRPAFGTRTPIDQRTTEDRQKAGLEQLNLPAITVPNLSNVHDCYAHRPEDAKENSVGVAAKHNQRQAETNPCQDRRC